MPSKRRAPTADGSGDVLTAREAAKYLRLGLPTLYRYMWQGKITSSKIGGRSRFKKSLLDRWLGKKAEGEDVSGRNKFVGKVSAIKRDAILAQVNLDVGEHKITAVITRDALDDLGIKVGDTAVALMKGSQGMIIQERRFMYRGAIVLTFKPARLTPLNLFVLRHAGVVTGVVLSFAHTMGEFGVVLMVGGNIPGVTRTVSIDIYDEVQALNYAGAAETALVLLIFSFVTLSIVYALNRNVWAVWPLR